MVKKREEVTQRSRLRGWEERGGLVCYLEGEEEESEGWEIRRWYKVRMRRDREEGDDMVA